MKSVTILVNQQIEYLANMGKDCFKTVAATKQASNIKNEKKASGGSTLHSSRVIDSAVVDEKMKIVERIIAGTEEWLV